MQNVGLLIVDLQDGFHSSQKLVNRIKQRASSHESIMSLLCIKK